MAYTLAEMAKVEREPLRKGIMLNLLRYSDILGVLPFELVSSLSNIVVRWKTLPGVGWRKLNEGYDEATGVTEQVTENIFLLGGDVDIDRVFLKVKNLIESPEVTQTKMKLKAVAYEFNDAFINGDQTVDEDELNGLMYRVGKLPARQTVDLGSDALKVFANTASENTFMDGLDKAIKRCSGGQCDALFMNETSYLGISSIIRRLGLLDTSKDQFGREIRAYKGIPLIDVGLKADGSTEIITDTEDPGDGGNDASSIYAVHFGTDEGLTGIQLEALDAYVVAEELEAKPVKRVRIDWPVGLANFGDFSIVRLNAFKMAAS